MTDRKKLKVYKVYPEDHARLERLGTREQTQPDIVHNLIAEPEWLLKFDSVYMEALSLNEEAKKSGKMTLATQAADKALSVLRAYIEHVKERSK